MYGSDLVAPVLAFATHSSATAPAGEPFGPEDVAPAAMARRPGRSGSGGDVTIKVEGSPPWTGGSRELGIEPRPPAKPQG